MRRPLVPAVLLLAAVLGGCTTAARKVEPTRAGTSLTLCDGRAVNTVVVDGARAVAEWRRLRDQVEETGLWPVILGAPPTAARVGSNLAERCEGLDYDPEEELRRVDRVDLDAELPKRRRELELDVAVAAPLPDYEYAKDVFFVPLDLESERPLPQVVIGLVPARVGWQVPVLLGFGDFNDSPRSAFHARLLQEWEREYGAEVISVTDDEIELRASRPPTTEAAAIALARKAYIYAPDVVDQGVGDLDVLAAGFLDGEAWYFWWD